MTAVVEVRRGRPRLPDPEKTCEWCARKFERKGWEKRPEFAARRFCSKKCNTDWMRGVPVENRDGYVKCATCGVRRPAASITEGKCNDWKECAETKSATEVAK